MSKDHNEEVKKIKQESLEAYEEMQEIIKQHELQYSEIEKENVDLKLKIQQINIDQEKSNQNVNKIQQSLHKKEEEVQALNTIIKEQEELMGNFDNLLIQKEQSIKDKYYQDLQNVRQQLIELQESNLKVVKDSSKIKEKHQQQILERDRKIREYIEKFKQMEIKLEKRDQEIKMLNEKIKLIVTKKQKYKKKSIDLNTKYDALDNQIRDLKYKMDSSFNIQEQLQLQSTEKNINLYKNQNETMNQQINKFKSPIGTNKQDSNNKEIPPTAIINAQKENLENFIRTQERNPLAQLINNQKGILKQQENTYQRDSNQEIKQTIRSERSSSTLAGNQSLANIKEKLKASAQNLQRVINTEISQERSVSQQKSNQNLVTMNKLPPNQDQQAAIAHLDQTNNTRLVEMKRKMMELEQAVKSKDLQNNLLKEEIHSKKQKSQADLSRKTRAVSQNNFI